MRKDIIIIGAGEAGLMLASEIKLNDHSKKYNVLGFIDDNTKIDKVLDYAVLGNINNILNIVNQYKKENINISEFIIAIPSADQKTLLKILNIIAQTDIKYKIVPGFFEIIQGSFSLKDIRDTQASDLLGREEVGFDEDILKDFYKNKTILVTGGAGSIGSEIVKQIITLPIKKVIALDYNENSLHALILAIKSENAINQNKFDFLVANILDITKIDKFLQSEKIDIIFHAAAHKHLPLMEKYPEEAIKNNILATNNLSKLAIKNNIKNFVFISTDKAVRPTSLMGASKRVCERIIHSYSKENHNTNFKITRFGNVLGSNGSVIPIFEKQIRNGEAITITHPEMVRFFMSIREAARLVIKASTLDNALIFTLDMGKQIKIIDLARNILRLHGLTEKDIPIVFTGIREGEKLYEEILMDNENLIPSPYTKLFTAEDKTNHLKENERKTMIEEFEIASTEYSKEEIKVLIKKYIKEYIIKN